MGASRAAGMYMHHGATPSYLGQPGGSIKSLPLETGPEDGAPKLLLRTHTLRCPLHNYYTPTNVGRQLTG